MAESSAKPVTAASAVLLVLVHFAAFMGVLVLGSALSSEDTVAVPFRAAALLVAPLVALYVGLIRHAPAESTLAALRLGRPARAQVAAIALAVVCGAALAPIVAAVYEWMLSLIPLDDVEKLSSRDLLMLGGAQLAGAAVLEGLFRGLVQPRLAEKLGPRRAFWTTVAVFAVAQVNVITFPISALLGVVCGLVVWASGTTWTSVALVVAMNGCLFFMPDGQPPWWQVAVGLAVAGLALFTSWRRRGP